MRKAPLPKLSYGEGSMFYNNDGDIVYKKTVYRSDGQRVRKSVKGSSVVECINRMKEKEQDLLKTSVNMLSKTDFKEEMPPTSSEVIWMISYITTRRFIFFPTCRKIIPGSTSTEAGRSSSAAAREPGKTRCGLTQPHWTRS